MSLDPRPSAIAIMGPTASGKTAFALEVAERFNGEIVSVDSALVYRGLDIGAAKPSADERARVPHHLLDVRDPWQVYSAADFAHDARRAMDDIAARGRLPVLAGGTGLYFQALLEGLAALPPADAALRDRIAARAQQAGWPALHAELARIDPEAAARIHATDPQRIQRALEVFHLTGTPISHWQRTARRERLPYRVLKLVLAPADRLQAQTAWSQAVLNRIKAEGTLKNALGTLANVMGLDAGQPLALADLPTTPPDTAFERDVDALIVEARERRPDLKAAEAQVKAAQASVDATRAAGLPTLSLGVGPTWQETRNTGNTATTHGNTIGLTLTIPFFSGFDTTYKVRSAQAKAESAGAQREALRQQVALDVWTAYQNLSTSTQTIRSTADLLASAEQSERVALGRYKAGVGTILDLLNAQSALASARLQRIQAMLDWNVSRAALAKAVGTLDSSLLNPDAAPRSP